MSNFQQYSGDPRVYPSYDLTVAPGDIIDFGVLPVPADGRWASHAGPATHGFDNTSVVVTSNVIVVNNRLVGTTSGAPTTGTWNAGDLVDDLTGAVYICTASGTPGTWVLQANTGITQGTADGRYAPITGSAAYRVKVPGEFVLSDYGTIIRDGTGDNTAAVNAAFAAMYAAGSSGTLLVGSGQIKCTGQITLPNDGGTIPAPTQPPYVLKGVGGHYNGQNALGSGGTRLILTYQGAGTTNDAKILTRGLGVFRCEDIVFQDTTANSSTPFIFTTGTTLKIKDCAFLGATAATACTQDALILGGTLKYASGPTGNGYGDANAPFQGYGTVIEGCYFNRVRRAVYGRSYCNQVVVSNNFFDKGCGTNLTGGACIEFDGSLFGEASGDTVTANVVTNNYFENSGGYYYQVKLTKASYSYIAGCNAEDPSPGSVFVALVGLFGVTVSAVNYASSDNTIVGNATQVANVMFEDSISITTNTLIHGSVNEGTRLPNLRLFATGQQIKDTAGNLLLNVPVGSLREWDFSGPISLVGSSAGAGTTYLNIGNHSTASDALLALDPPTGQSARIHWRLNNADQWWLYNAASSLLFLRDQVNGVMQLTFTPGSGLNGHIAAGCTFYPVQAATASAPTYVKGGMYFDTTLNKLRIGGASAWETVTSA